MPSVVSTIYKGTTDLLENYIMKYLVCKSADDRRTGLIGGLELLGLMIECDLGVAHVGRYDVKRIDSDFFGTEE